MMNRDFRVHNLIQVEGKVYNIVSVLNLGYVTYYSGGYINLFITKDNCIPLTEEWLVKFGFHKYDKNRGLKEEYQKPDNFGYNIGNYHWHDGYLFLDGGNNCVWEIPCQHVHQLQNLYYTLTGKELDTL